MNKGNLVAIGLLLTASASAVAQYGDRTNDGDRRTSQRPIQRFGFRDNWGLRQEENLLQRLQLSRDQWERVRELESRVQRTSNASFPDGWEGRRELMGYRDQDQGMAEIFRGFHRDLRGILDREQNDRYDDLWLGEMHAHRNWWTWEFDIQKGIVGRFFMDRRQRDRFNDLNAEIGHEVDVIIDGLRRDRRHRGDLGDFGRRTSRLMERYHEGLLRILGDEQRERFERDLRIAVVNRNADDKIRSVWVQSL